LGSPHGADRLVESRGAVRFRTGPRRENDVTKVTLVCRQCGYKARRALAWPVPGSRGTHETPSEPATCPKGHGSLVRSDGFKWGAS
jgi:hypothetical protein